MGEQWVKECTEFLSQIRRAQAAENLDRLDLVRAMHIALLALNHSVWGWLQYVNNPDIMGKFTRDELNEIMGFLGRFAGEFIEHDIKVTKAGMAKGLSEAMQQRQDQQPFYV